jgi:hypothetical protein
MSVSLAKPYTFHPAGTYLCDDNHGAWFMVVNAAVPARATLRELTDDGYVTTETVADVRAYEPLSATDVEMWNKEQDHLREEREDRWNGAYWED